MDPLHHPPSQANPRLNWHTDILATHEEPQTIALGPWPGDAFPGVALPYRPALAHWIVLRYRATFTLAYVADVGPWVIDDEAYVLNGDRPRVEQYLNQPPPPLTLAPTPTSATATLPDGTRPQKCNGAGIDLFPAVAKALHIPWGENVTLDWRFLCLTDLA